MKQISLELLSTETLYIILHDLETELVNAEIARTIQQVTEEINIREELAGF